MERILNAPRPSARITRRTLVAGGAVAVTALAIGAALPARYVDRVYPGTTVLGQDLSGLSTTEVVSRIQGLLQSTLDALVTFRLDEQEWVASAADLGVAVDWDAFADRVMANGRGTIPDRAATLLPWSDTTTIPVPVSLDHGVLNRYLARLDTEVAFEPVNATLDGTGPSITIIPDQDGRQVDFGLLREIVVAAAGSLAPEDTVVPVVTITAAITAPQLAATKDRVLRLTEEPLTITDGRDSWTIAPEDLTGGLVMPEDVLTEDPWLDPWWIGQLVDPVVDALFEPATDATLAWDGGLYASTRSSAGRIVDRDDLIAQVIAAADTDEREVRVVTTPVEPRISGDRLDELGISSLLTVGDSSFVGSSEARTTNVGVAARWVSQTAIAPDEVFSFNDSLGEITLERGYVTGKIIKGDWFADDIGGGVCQVSTTVYRAALYAGLPFLEWHPHSARVTFYEQDGWPIGVDAAIYQIDEAEGWPLDLKFRNTTGAWLLLQMVNTGTTIVAQLYGSPTGWQVEIPEPVVGEPIPAPAPQIRISDELAPGERREIQQSQTGVNVELSRTVTDSGGNVLLNNTFKSFYAPLPKITEVGETTPPLD